MQLSLNLKYNLKEKEIKETLVVNIQMCHKTFRIRLPGFSKLRQMDFSCDLIDAVQTNIFVNKKEMYNTYKKYI